VTRTVTVEVTAEDIEQGMPGVTDACALALAIRRVTGEPFLVGAHGFGISEDEDDDDIALPVHVVEFRREYDRGNEVTPFSFTLELPE
jgi:hypothetical protein